MAHVRKIAANSLMLGGSSAIAAVCAFVLAYVLSRYLGVDEYGKYSFVLAFLSFFFVVADLGVGAIVTREIARDLSCANLYLSNGLLIRMGLSLSAILIANGMAWSLGYSGERLRLILLFSLSFFFFPVSVLAGLFSATLKLQYQAAVDSLVQIGQVLGILAVVWHGGTLLQILAVQVTISAVSALLYFLFSRRILRFRIQPDRKVMVSLLRESWPLALNSVFVTILFRVDQILIQWFKGDHALGIYSVAVRFSEFFVILPTIYFSSLFPLLARYRAEASSVFESMYRQTFKHMLLLVFPISLISFLEADRIVQMIYGEPFRAAADVLRILAWSQPLIFVGAANYHILLAANQQRVVSLLAVLSALANVGLNLWLIPLWGVIGAAVATVISYVVGYPLCAIIEETREYMQTVFRLARWPLGITAGMVVVFTIFPPSSIVLALLVPTLFYGLLFLARYFDASDVCIWKELLVGKES